MSLPYFPMYPTDFEAKTSHLTLEEDGAYNRLLRLCWMTPGCSLPDDRVWIMRRMRVDAATYDRVVMVVLDEFFTQKTGRQNSDRLTKEWKKSDLAHCKRVSSGSMGGKAKALNFNDKNPSNTLAMLYQPEPEPEPYKKEKKEKEETRDALSFLTAWASQNAAESFIAYRKKHKSKALTLTGAKRLGENLKAIFNDGGDPSDALGMAEERGWTTVHPDWYFNARGKNGTATHHGVRPGPHNALMAGFAMAANSKPQ